MKVRTEYLARSLVNVKVERQKARLTFRRARKRALESRLATDGLRMRAILQGGSMTPIRIELHGVPVDIKS